MIRNCNIDDAARICEIYNYFIANSSATFEQEPVSECEMKERIGNTISHYPWIVQEIEGTISGYAYATRWKERAAYRYSVESTVYIDPAYLGKGVGTQLMEELIARLASMDIHSILAGITLPNDASIALHEKLGFQKAAHLKQVGRKFERWIDVGYWELILE